MSAPTLPFRTVQPHRGAAERKVAKADKDFSRSKAVGSSACRGCRGTAQASGVPWGLSGQEPAINDYAPPPTLRAQLSPDFHISICMPLSTATMHVEAVATLWKTSPSDDAAFLAMFWASFAR